MRTVTHSVVFLTDDLDDKLDDDQFSNIWYGKSEWLTFHLDNDDDAVANDILVGDIFKVRATGSLKVIKGTVAEVNHYPAYGPSNKTNRAVINGAITEVKLKDIEKYLDTKQSKLSKLIVT